LSYTLVKVTVPSLLK